MEWTGLNEIREKFLTFFESKDHLRMDSAPLVPIEDNSLLLINSGMAPLKKYFMGQETPPRKRATSCQKCIRTPDIERVGKTSRHGTYFEMLGNFSFGDYFKEEATTWAWEFITEVMEMPVDKLWVSIYQDDDEAFDIWTKRRGVSPDRIVRLGKEDNFWEIGTGPCGPCSEIYFDRGEENGCGSPDCAVGCDCDRFVEFWNLVFTQFDSDGEGNYEKLAKPNIDTGMGLERLACISQGVDNLFEVDTVQNIMKHICDIAKVEYKKDAKTDVSLRVITDHIRSTVFMVGDGVVPQNEGRGYVLKRLLRRAARHGRLLGIEKPFLFEVCDTVIKENATAYPELVERGAYIKKLIKIEEEKFSKTINQGLEMLEEIVKSGEIITGEQAFKLYDTYGFPLDLTAELAEEKGLSVDEDGFNALMEEQRERARTARANMTAVGWKDDESVDLSGITTSFVGYENAKAESEILKLIRDNEEATEAYEGENVVIILENTPFYAESGGQIGDTGVICTQHGEVEISDCKKASGGAFLHFGKVTKGTIDVSETVTAKIDTARRAAITRNHTSAHLLQSALRTVLGDHVHQAGSYVSDTRVRFDFAHFSGMTAEEIAETERLVNAEILKATAVENKEMPIDEAKKLGALALFGEKYGQTVRICNVPDFSLEFCGGTHVKNTANIGLFKIISESSVAAGVRRIEGTTGLGVLDLLAEAQDNINKSAATLKLTNSAELSQKVVAVAEEIKAKDKVIESLESKIAEGKVDGLFENAVEIAGVRLITASFSGTNGASLKAMGEKISDKAPNMVAVLIGTSDGKTSVVTVCGKNAVEKGMHAGKIIKEITAITGGNGGGRPDNAMGGIADVMKIDEAFVAMKDILEKMAK